jgi:hypothetical protein
VGFSTPAVNANLIAGPAGYFAARIAITRSLA